MSEVVRLATWNIHSCVGPDARFDPHRVVAVLKTLRADVIALQEVEASRFGGEDVLAFLAAQTGMTPIAGPTLKRRDADYGNALLTALPVGSIEHVDLSVTGAEPRGLIDAVVGAGSRAIRLLATHLGLRRSERRRQVCTLLERLDRPGAGHTALLGDFNEWWPWSRNLRRIKRRFPTTHVFATFPSRLPVLSLDRIWLRGHHGEVSAGCLRAPAARRASDHLPVWLDLRC